MRKNSFIVKQQLSKDCIVYPCCYTCYYARLREATKLICTHSSIAKKDSRNYHITEVDVSSSCVHFQSALVLHVNEFNVSEVEELKKVAYMFCERI